MRRNQIEIVIEELQRIWRGSRTMPHPDTWRSVLAHLDAETAVKTVVWLMDRTKSAPSIAEFREAYRIVDDAKVRRPQAQQRCSECEGTGRVAGPTQQYAPSLRMLAAAEEDHQAAIAAARIEAQKAGVDFDPATVRWEPPAYEYTSAVPCLHCAAGKRASASQEGK